MKKTKETSSIENTSMMLNIKKQSVHKGHYGSLKLVLMILLFANLCNMSSGAYPTKPAFVIANRKCGKFVHPKSGSGSSYNGDPLHLWSSAPWYIKYDFEPAYGKWGHIRHINSGRYWHPKDPNSNDNGNKIHLWSSKPWYAKFALDQVTGNIKHINGKYVHVKSRSCDHGAILHLWDNPYPVPEWTFVNPYQTSKEVLPYGSFNTFGEWQLVFALHNPLATQTFRIEHKEGRSKSAGVTSQFQFQWQVGASAKTWFGEVSTSVTLSNQITRSSSRTWYEEATMTQIIRAEVGQSVAVWQQVLTGEQLGNREAFQSNFFAHTSSRYEKPPRYNRRTSIITRQRFGSRVYYYYLNDTETVDVHLNESQGRNLYQSQGSMFITQQKFENTNEDRSIPMKNDTEDNDYDENGVFSIYPYAIVDDDVTDREINVQANHIDRKSNEHDLEVTKEDESIPMTKTTEDIDYDENGVFALYPYAIVDDDDAEKQDE